MSEWAEEVFLKVVKIYKLIHLGRCCCLVRENKQGQGLSQRKPSCDSVQMDNYTCGHRRVYGGYLLTSPKNCSMSMYMNSCLLYSKDLTKSLEDKCFKLQHKS